MLFEVSHIFVVKYPESCSVLWYLHFNIHKKQAFCDIDYSYTWKLPLANRVIINSSSCLKALYNNVYRQIPSGILQSIQASTEEWIGNIFFSYFLTIFVVGFQMNHLKGSIEHPKYLFQQIY